MKNKLLFFAVLFLVCSSHLCAQGNKEDYYPDNRFEIIGGFGADPLVAYNDFPAGVMDIWYFGPESVQEMFDRCYDAKYSMTYALEFAYHYKKRWDICASAGYSTVDVTYFDPFTNQQLSKDHSFTFDIQAGIRRYHKVKKSFSMYSQLTVGASFYGKSDFWDINYKYSDSNIPRYLAFQITGLGLSLGKKLFASAEFGWGTEYIMVGVLPGCKFGVGYRF